MKRTEFVTDPSFKAHSRPGEYTPPPANQVKVSTKSLPEKRNRMPTNQNPITRLLHVHPSVGMVSSRIMSCAPVADDPAYANIGD